MRKWKDLAAPDDPSAWYSVFGMWPTRLGTYATADISSGTSKTASGAGFVKYAFCARTLTGTREYVVDSNKIWEYSGGSLTDRTGGVTIGSAPHMAQYGNITICAMGTSNSTVYSTGGNFAALAGAPNGEIVCVQTNAVLIFNTATSADGWAASDIGDYTNWSTGEAASGRLIQTPGPITAAVSLGNDVFVFKRDAIYRMTYVGGVVKWQAQLVWNGLGCSTAQTLTNSKYQCVATSQGIAFGGAASVGSNYYNKVYLFDGASSPVLLNPLTNLLSCEAVYVYNPLDNILCLAPAEGSSAAGGYRTGASTSDASLYYYYSFDSGAWGSGRGSAEEDRESGTSFPTQASNGVLQGDYYARSEGSSKPVYWRYRSVTTGAHYRCAPLTPSSAVTQYLQTSKFGDARGKTMFDRLIPLLRQSSGTAELTMRLSNERHYDLGADTIKTVTQSADRKRFDLKNGAAESTFGQFRVTWDAQLVEVDDFQVEYKTRNGN